MEYRLLTPHEITLQHEGIPYRSVEHLLIGGKFHDANLQHGFGRTSELEEINRMEARLGKLSPEQLDLRIAADCCCIWRYDYPQRVHEICAAIGGTPHTAARLHYQICPRRRQEFMDYAEALKAWFMDLPVNDADRSREGFQAAVQKVYGFLGTKDALKSMLVERTYLGLSSRFLNCSFWGYNARESETALHPFTAQPLAPDWHQRMSVLEHGIRDEMGPDAHDFLCEVGGAAEPACHFKFIRRVDILVSSIGCLRWRGNLPPKDGRVKGRRKLTKVYLDILESYWSGQRNSRGSNDGSRLEEELFELLGDPSDLKRWLVASLWKNVKNQTEYEAFPMKRWVEFVRIGEDYLRSLSGCSSVGR